MPDPIVDRLLAYIDASPTPFHAAAAAAAQLDDHGFERVHLGGAPHPLAPGACGYVLEAGSIVAFRMGREAPQQAGFRMVAAHTDSPNLRVKPNPYVRNNGYVRLGVEVYGGAIVASWPDRDLGIAGRLAIRDGKGTRHALVDLRRPLCRIPNLAIHLNRRVNEDGLKLNNQKQLPAVFTLSEDKEADPLRELLAEAADCAPDAILAWDLSLYDLTPSTISGAGGEFVHAPRLDNLASCHAGLEALAAALDDDAPAETCLLGLFDHEEIGSRSVRGAQSGLMHRILERLARDAEAQAGGGVGRALANSLLVSADMSHAVHPGYADKHDAEHMPLLNKGPVIKQHTSQRYATESDTAAAFIRLCEAADAPYQWFVNRSDLACGSTVGPILAAGLAVRGVDVGNPMLSMHSAREMCGAADQPWMVGAMTALFKGA